MAEKHRLVLIEWLDSYGCSPSWEPIDSVNPLPMTVRSVGWLICDAKECKVIVPHLSEANHPNGSQQGCGDMTIPAVAILKITDLSMATAKSKRKRHS